MKTRDNFLYFQKFNVLKNHDKLTKNFFENFEFVLRKSIIGGWGGGGGLYNFSTPHPHQVFGLQKSHLNHSKPWINLLWAPTTSVEGRS